MYAIFAYSIWTHSLTTRTAVSLSRMSHSPSLARMKNLHRPWPLTPSTSTLHSHYVQPVIMWIIEWTHTYLSRVG